MNVDLFQLILLFHCLIVTVSSLSLIDAYRSEKLTRRRLGMRNTNFRPILNLRGEDDWQKEINDNFSPNQFMDENGIVYDMNPTISDRITSFFNTEKVTGRRFGRKKRSNTLSNIFKL